MKKGQSRRPTLRMIASICAISLLVTVAGSFPAFAIEAATVFENSVYNIKNVNSGMMLDVANGTDANGTNVWQYTADGTNAQKWKMVYDTAGDFYYIKAMISDSGTNRQLDVYCTSSDPVASGHNVQIWVQGDDPSSTWSIVHVSSGRYKIVLKQYPTLALTVANSSTSSGANVIVQTYSGATSQLWTFEEAAPAATSGITSGGVYRIGIISGTSFVTVNGNVANGTTLFRNLLTPGKQEWKIHYLSNGYYVIRHNSNPALAMYATSGGVQIRTVSTTNNSDLPTNAQWKIVKNDGNTTTGYRLVPKSSQGNALTYSQDSNATVTCSIYTANSSTQRWWFFGVNDADPLVVGWYSQQDNTKGRSWSATNLNNLYFPNMAYDADCCGSNSAQSKCRNSPLYLNSDTGSPLTRGHIGSWGCHMSSLAMLLKNMDISTANGHYDVRTGTTHSMAADPYTVTMANINFLSATTNSNNSHLEILGYTSANSPVSFVENRLNVPFGVTLSRKLEPESRDKRVIAEWLDGLLDNHPEGILIRITDANGKEQHSLVMIRSNYDDSETYTDDELDSLFICYDPGTSQDNKGNACEYDETYGCQTYKGGIERIKYARYFEIPVR